jgi:hypothetical protein
MLNPFSHGWSLDWVGVPLVNGLLEGLYRISLGVVNLVVGGIVGLGAGLLLLPLLTETISTLTLLVFGRFDPMSALWLDMAAEPVPHGAHTPWFTFGGIRWSSKPVARWTFACGTVNRIPTPMRSVSCVVGSEKG